MIDFGLDEENAANYELGENNYKCLLCQETTTIDSSVSNKGRKMLCESCVDKLEYLLDMSYSDIISRIHGES